MNRLLAVSSLCWLALSPLVAAGDELSRAALSAQLAVDTRLLAEALRSYADVRIQERAAQAALAAVETRLDLAFSQESSTPPQLDLAEQERAVAEAALRVLASRAGRLREQLFALSRRLASARAELAREAPLLAGGGDPVSGRWRVEISSPPQQGTFELRLDGAQVTGSFQFPGGRQGSLSGTFSGGRLRLERRDSQRGFDGLFDGTVDASLGTVRGFYSPAEMAAGEPAGSGWSGVRLGAVNRSGSGGGEGS